MIDGKQRLEEILSSGAPLIEHMFSESGNFCDVIQADGILENTTRKPAEPANLIDLVMTRLGHIPVNPSKSDVTRLINNAYVFPDSDREDIGDDIVNQSPESVKAFAYEIIDAAKRERARSLTSNEQVVTAEGIYSQSNHFSLTGDRGVGKSFFLNHLLSTHNDLFDDEGVVYIRINLVQNKSFDNDLVGWYLAQITKVLLRYYDKRSERSTKQQKYRHGFYDYLLSYIEAHHSWSDARKSEKVTKLEAMAAAFMGKDDDRQITPSWCPSDLCQQLAKYARVECGLSFVVVFDGFDRLDRDRFHTDRYNQIQAGVTQLTSDSLSHGAAFVVVSRRLFTKIRSQPDPFHSRIKQHFRVASPNFEEIFNRRLAVLQDELKNGRIPRHSSDEQLNALSILNDFENEKLFENEINQQLIHSMENNNRAKVQIIQLLFQEFCSRESRGGYRIIEHMIKAGMSYPPILYIYEEIDGKVHAHLTPHYVYDSRFLPLLTRPPIPGSPDNPLNIKADRYRPETVLIGIRILQILNVWNSSFRNGNNFEPLTVREICEILEELFGYDPSISENAIYELECFETVLIDRKMFGNYESNFDTVKILPKADHLLGRFAFDLAYLNLCGMRLITREGFHKNHSFLQSASLDERTMPGTSHSDRLKKWINAKVRNSITTAALLIALNAQQRINLGEPDGRLLLSTGRALEYSRIKSIFSVFDKWPKEISSEIYAITQSSAEKHFNLDDLDGVLNYFEEKLSEISDQRPRD